MTIMKIIIATAFILLAFAPVAYGATDRELFMCSVGTADETVECPKFEPIEMITPVLEKPLEVNLAPEPQILATSTESEKIAQLKALIEQLQILIALLKAQQAHGG